MRRIIVTIWLVFLLEVGSEDSIETWSDHVADTLFETALKGWTLHSGSRALPIGTRVAHRYSGVDGVAPLTHYRPELVDRVARAVPRTTSLRGASMMLAPGEGRAGSGTPPELTSDICLVPGEPIVRIEKAPNNAVRIFTGIDVVAPMHNVWAVLTDYENLHKVVPSIVRNEVVERFESGARLAQSAAAKVLPGLSFSAKMVLDVQLYQDGLPESKHRHRVGGSSADVREFDAKLPLRRGIFPRPYAVTSLPHKDITMANAEGLPGDFDHYQGVWRVQPLPGCAPEGGEAARLTYAVEIKPKGFLPVHLIENRIASDLKKNLQAIRDYVETNVDLVTDLARRSSKLVESSLPTAKFEDAYSATPKATVEPSLPTARLEDVYSANSKSTVESSLPTAKLEDVYSANPKATVESSLPTAELEDVYNTNPKATLSIKQQHGERETRARWFRPKMKKLLMATRAYFQSKLGYA